jgi:hypothetical protein
MRAARARNAVRVTARSHAEPSWAAASRAPYEHVRARRAVTRIPEQGGPAYVDGGFTGCTWRSART